MLRSWGNRADTFVCDEPLYAHYLVQTGIEHPGRDEVTARHETDWRTVVEDLTGPIPEGKSIFYQKHMAHHLLENIDRAWLGELTHGFLIREPVEMLTSLIAKWPNPTLVETGLEQQVELVRFVERNTGRIPPIVDARDLLEDPRGMLGKLCDAIGVEFSDSMLSWPAGRRDTDGIWAKHWYANVEKSTGFQRYRPKDARVPDACRDLLDECNRLYQQLYALRIR